MRACGELTAGMQREERSVAEVLHARGARLDVRSRIRWNDLELSVGDRGEHDVARVTSVRPEQLVRQVLVTHFFPPTVAPETSSSNASAIALRPRVTHVATVPSGTFIFLAMS